MNKSTLTNFPNYGNIRNGDSVVEKNVLGMDFHQVHFSHDLIKSITNTSPKRNAFSTFSTLAFFLFSTVLFAQQPACNLNGVLEARRVRDGGQNFTISSEAVGIVPGTIYKWEFKANNSAASFVSQNGLPNMTINPGNKNGNFNLKLTVINPPNSRGAGKSCSCIKSVSISNL